MVAEHHLLALEIKFIGTDPLRAEATHLFQSLKRENQHPTVHGRPHHMNETTAVLGLLQPHGQTHKLRDLRHQATATATLVLHQAVQRRETHTAETRHPYLHQQLLYRCRRTIVPQVPPSYLHRLAPEVVHPSEVEETHEIINMVLVEVVV